MATDPIADLLTRIRNAAAAGHPTVSVPASKVKLQILRVLQEDGYIDRFDSVKDAASKPAIKIFIRYAGTGVPVIQEIKRLSTPGRRRYVSTDEIPRARGGLGVVVVSTSKGVMTDREARRQGIGGELICSVF